MLIKIQSQKYGVIPFFIPIYENPSETNQTRARTFTDIYVDNQNFQIEGSGFWSKSVIDGSAKDKEFWDNFGFPQNLLLNMDDYIGDVWTFSNGVSGTITVDSLGRYYFVTGGNKLYLATRTWGIVGISWPMPTPDSQYAYQTFSFSYNSSSDTPNQQFPTNRRTLSEWEIEFYSTVTEATPEDPFEPGGGSGTGGGGGDFDNTSTPIDIPGLPSISASSTGFISLFNPSLSQLNDLASYLWSDLFEIDGWKKLFADPMDAILGLSILPVSIPSGGTREVKVGNIGTGISLTVASSQFVEVDCGSIDVNEYWGAYLDYEPYTQAQIFLPYIGTRPISVDEIMGKTVRVVYHVDILTGACCCFVKCGDSVLYTYNGQCSIPIPITGANYTSVVNGVISIAASVGSLVATGGASAPTAIPAIASSAVNQMKPQIEKSSSISGSAGVLNMQTPYLILIRPRQALPSKQNEFIGYPSLITVQLTELSGYTEVQSIHLENIPATQEELAEIQSLLEGGVIF